MPTRRLLLFTKPARPGRVKTRLTGELSPERAAELHAAFLADLVERLDPGGFELRLAWAVEDDEPVPEGPAPGERQRGADLGERLYRALAAAAGERASVAAVGSDHPELSLERVEEAFAALEAGAPMVLGPAEDGGYYLVGLRSEALAPGLFRHIPWSTDAVLEVTLERCRELGIDVHLLPGEADVDTPDDLRRLARRLAAGECPDCPRSRRLLEEWGWLPESAGAGGGEGAGGRRWETESEAGTEAVGRELAAELTPDATLLLRADLGAGKTVLTRGVAAGLGIEPREVQSPTFTLVREHAAGDRRLLHVDLYRLDAAEVEAMGLEELLAGEGVKVVEWAERIPFPPPEGAVTVTIARSAQGRREIRVERPGGA